MGFSLNVPTGVAPVIKADFSATVMESPGRVDRHMTKILSSNPNSSFSGWVTLLSSSARYGKLTTAGMDE